MSAIADPPKGVETEIRPLDTRTILQYFVPLAMSWMLMGIDGPVNVSVIQRLPRPELGAAGFTILFAVSIWIEAPIIDLLATATTLATTYKRYQLLRRFVLALIVLVTVTHLLVNATPIYWFVTEKLLALPHELAVAVRPALLILTPWSGLIGWRRAHQGIMIRNGMTRAIGLGTALRGIVLVLVAFGLMFAAPQIPSLVIAACSLITSVFSEALFVHFVSRSAVRQLPLDDDDPPLTLRALYSFHLPLTATTMVALMMGPMVTGGLARSPHPIQSLAAYQVASSAFFLFRMSAFCLPEIVITLGKDDQSIRKLRRFALSFGLIGSVGMLFMAITGLDALFFGKVLHAPPDIVGIAHWTFLGCSALPLVDSAQSFVRGVLTAQFRTTSRLVAVGAAIAGLGVVLVLGVSMRWPGFVLAGSAITAGLACELLALVVAVRRPLPSAALAA